MKSALLQGEVKKMKKIEKINQFRSTDKKTRMIYHNFFNTIIQRKAALKGNLK